MINKDNNQGDYTAPPLLLIIPVRLGRALGLLEECVLFKGIKSPDKHFKSIKL